MRSARVYRAIYDSLLSRFYDLAMGWYMLPFGGRFRFRRGMLAPLAFAPDERVLDATCGTGGCTAAIRTRAGPAATVVGSDLSRGQLRRARRKDALAGVPLLQADASRLPFRSGAFDTVCLSHSLHEMPRAVRLAALREARRVCSPGGRVAALELDRPEPLWLRLLMGLWFFFWVPPPLNFEASTRRDLQRRGVAREIAEAGFAGVRKHPRFAGTMQVVEGRVAA